MKLISMTDYLPEHPYSIFLKQPLELWMFVPCDENGNVLKFNYPQSKAFDEIAQMAFEKQYQQAKERCLFEGWELVHNGKWGAEISKDKITGYLQFNISNYKCVEDLLWDRQLILTQTAIKKL